MLACQKLWIEVIRCPHQSRMGALYGGVDVDLNLLLRCALLVGWNHGSTAMDDDED